MPHDWDFPSPDQVINGRLRPAEIGACLIDGEQPFRRCLCAVAVVDRRNDPRRHSLRELIDSFFVKHGSVLLPIAATAFPLILLPIYIPADVPCTSPLAYRNSARPVPSPTLNT